MSVANQNSARLRVVPKPRKKAKPQSRWSKDYRDRHRPRKIFVPGSKDGRVGRVTLYQRGPNIQLRWRQNGKNAYDLVKSSEYENCMAEALARAAAINRELVERSAAGRTFQRATIREACLMYLEEREASPDCSGPTLRKYTEELTRVVQFAETTKEGRRCRFLDQLDSRWCQQFCAWLDVQKTTPRGKRIGGDVRLG